MSEPAMDEVPGPPALPPTQPQSGPLAEAWITPADLRFAAVTIAALAVLGALAGIGWSVWSRTATRGLVYTKSAIIPDQTEGFISSDGRFVVITAVIGLLAGALVWRQRIYRGPVAVAALAVGCALGAALTDLVGRLIGGGAATGKLNTVLARLPLRVHAVGLLFVEGLLAVGLYLVFAAFVNPDDLGRDRVTPAGSDDASSATAASADPSALVGAAVDLQQPGRDRHTAGPPEQDDLAPQ